MPSFARKKDRYFVSYITGPSHVLLGLSFGPAGTQPVVVRESRPNHCDHGPVDESRIREAVMAGVAEAGVQLHPAEIVYFEGDSPRYELYQRCGYVLAQRVAAGAEIPENGDTAA